MNKAVIEIGTTPLRSITIEDLRMLAMISGCTPSLEYWKEPEVVEFDNTLFHDTVFIEFKSFRLHDNKESDLFTFYFNFEDLRYNYSREKRKFNHYVSQSHRCSIKIISYLILRGYEIPFITSLEEIT